MYTFIDDRRHVRKREIAAEVRKPTVRTVLTFLHLFAGEILAVRRSMIDHKIDLNPEDPGAIDAIVHGLKERPADAARVLATCCRLYGRNVEPCEVITAEVLEEDPDLLEAVARAVLELTDLAVVARNLDLDALDAMAIDEGDGESPDQSLLDDQPTDHEIALVATAARLGIDPFSISEWPFEGWLRVVEIVPQLGPDPRSAGNVTPGATRPVEMMTATNALPGITVHQARKPE